MYWLSYSQVKGRRFLIRKVEDVLEPSSESPCEKGLCMCSQYRVWPMQRATLMTAVNIAVHFVGWRGHIMQL